MPEARVEGDHRGPTQPVDVTELVTGLTIGLAAGISPGPLQALVVTSSLERGFGAGWRVAVAPLLTDAPIIAVGVAVASAVPPGALNGLGVAGGIAVILIGLWSLRGRAEEPVARGGAGDVWRGAIVNALSPHPWGFWVAAGGPILVSGWRKGPGYALAFLAGFYVLLIGSKVALAWVVAGTRHRLSEQWRRRLVVGGATLMVFGGAVVLWQGATGRFG